MKKLSLMIIMALFGLQALKAQDTVEEFGVFNHLGVGVGLVTTGIDFELAAPVGDFFQVRAGYSFFPKTSYKYKSDIDYTKYGKAYKGEVEGPNPSGPTTHVPTLRSRLFAIWGFSSAGRAIALHAIGQRFDPANLHHFYE